MGHDLAVTTSHTSLDMWASRVLSSRENQAAFRPEAALQCHARFVQLGGRVDHLLGPVSGVGQGITADS